MSHRHHEWRVGNDPPEIRPHSLAKHRVLRAYLEQYVSVLTKNPRQDHLRLTLVDGFAGGGKYIDSRTKEERAGSPLIMLEAMEAAAETAQQLRSKPFHLDVHYFFIEKNRHAIDYLRSVLAESRFARMVDRQIIIVHGEFTAQVPQITEFVRRRGRAHRAIFVLDQFGYAEVPLPTLRQILSSLDNAEIVLTFATGFLIDYLNESEQTQRMLADTGISLPSKAIRTAKEERDWRRAIQFLLHREIPEKTGAKFYTPFFIRSSDSGRDFWLIHLSGHYRARDVMVGLHWKEGTSFAHYGRSGLRMLGYDQRLDSEWTSQQMLPGFYFDQTALTSSQEELLEQLPQRLPSLTDGIAFSQLFAQLTNECPVTAAIMKGVLNELAKDGVIEVRDKSGAKSRRAGIQHDSDVIVVSRQKRIFMP